MSFKIHITVYTKSQQLKFGDLIHLLQTRATKKKHACKANFRVRHKLKQKIATCGKFN